MSNALEHSAIQPGLHVESVESSRAPRGDAYAVMQFPFAIVAAAFAKPANWCESLILHLNVQYCRASLGGGQLSAAVGKKTNQPLEDTHRINFSYKVAASDSQFMRVELAAREGPLGTGNYLIALELIALDDARSFMHIQYSYTQGYLARVATSVYFATRGRDKVGFTVLDDGDDPPHLVARHPRGAGAKHDALLPRVRCLSAHARKSSAATFRSQHRTLVRGHRAFFSPASRGIA